jgi:hypothetical protein
VVQSAALMTVVADREADIYPLWGTVPDPNCHVLTRARLAKVPTAKPLE